MSWLHLKTNYNKIQSKIIKKKNDEKLEQNKNPTDAVAICSVIVLILTRRDSICWQTLHTCNSLYKFNTASIKRSGLSSRLLRGGGEGRGIHIILTLRQSNTGADHHHRALQGRPGLPNIWIVALRLPLHVYRRQDSVKGRSRRDGLRQRSERLPFSVLLVSAVSRFVEFPFGTPSQQRAATPDHLAFKPPRPQTDYVPLRT